jgi:hypothetical protein
MLDCDAAMSKVYVSNASNLVTPITTNYKHIICIHVSRAKKIANAAAGGFGKPVGVLTAEAVDFTQIQNMGGLSRSGRVLTEQSRKGGRNNESIICVNPVSTIQFLFWS